MRWSMGVALVMLVGAGAAVTHAQKPQAPARPAAVAANAVKPVATVGEIMQLMTIPLSNAVFEAGGEPPKDDKSWDDVRGKAIALAESGNLLMMVPRARDGDEWMRLSKAMIDTGAVAIKAAEAKDPDAMFEAGAQIYAVCSNCHAKYDPSISRVQ